MSVLNLIALLAVLGTLTYLVWVVRGQNAAVTAAQAARSKAEQQLAETQQKLSEAEEHLTGLRTMFDTMSANAQKMAAEQKAHIAELETIANADLHPDAVRDRLQRLLSGTVEDAAASPDGPNSGTPGNVVALPTRPAAG